MSFRRRTSETIAGLQQELDALKAQVAQASPPPSPPAPPPPPPPTAAAAPLTPPAPGNSLAEVHDLVRELSQRVEGLDQRQLRDHERLSLRLEELTTQFTNQLVELDHELDSAHQSLTSRLTAQDQRFDALTTARANDHDDESATALVEELRTNQVRIANDLARHEIAIRQDLANLAELVHRSRPERSGN
jgi:exonuclease VII large subunit